MTDFSKDHLTAIRTELGKISALSDIAKDFILTNLGDVMTEQTWNKEQIEAAMVNAKDCTFLAGSIEAVISELTKPAPVFKAGEVYVNEESHGYYLERYAEYQSEKDFQFCRHLTPTEKGLKQFEAPKYPNIPEFPLGEHEITYGQWKVVINWINKQLGFGDD